MTGVRAANTVLLVVRRHATRQRLAAALGEAGLDVRCTDSAADCIRIVRKLVPAVIVMARALEDGDGWELVRVLKSLSSTRGVPVIAVAEEDQARRHEERALLVGCDVVVSEPVDADRLLDQIRKVLPVDSGREP